MSGTSDVGFEDLQRCPFTSANASDDFRCCESKRETVRSDLRKGSGWLALPVAVVNELCARGSYVGATASAVSRAPRLEEIIESRWSFVMNMEWLGMMSSEIYNYISTTIIYTLYIKWNSLNDLKQ